MEQYLLGIDVGTTGAKALLFSTSGAFLAQAYAAYPLSTPQLDWQEQRAEDWWDAVVQTVRSVCGDPAVARNVISLSLSTQGGTFVPVDAHGHALRPAIVWSDSRTQQERDAFLREVGPAETMYQKTGWPLGLALLAQDIRWMRTHEPELFSKTALFLSVPSFLSYRMTGIAACDLSNAGIDQLCDVRKGCYDEQLLQFAGVRASQLPVLVRSGEPIGHLTPAAAKTLGLETGCVLIAGAHDQYAAALGAGMTHDGDILIGSGTCWVVTMLRSCPDFSSGLAQSVSAVPGLWGTLLSLPTGGVCLDWLRRNIARGESGDPLSYETLNREIALRRAGTDGLFFVPFQAHAGGQAFTRASWIGMDLSHDRFHLARAVMEGVAFQIRWMLEDFPRVAADSPLKLTGGASKSAVWSQIVADVIGAPVCIPALADLACVGAAALAGTGAGIYPDTAAAHAALAIRERIIRPSPDAAACQAAYEAYKTSTLALAAACRHTSADSMKGVF